MSQFSELFTDSATRSLLRSPTFVKGQIFAVAACPEIPLPERWMPWMLTASPSAQAITPEQVDAMADGLMAQLRDCLDAMRTNSELLPTECQWSDEVEGRYELEEWLKGLLSVHQQLETHWQQAWTLRDARQPETSEPAAQRLHRCLKLFSTLADADQALQNTNEAHRETLQQGLPKLFAQLPAMLREYVTLAGDLAGYLPNQFESFVQD